MWSKSQCGWQRLCSYIIGLLGTDKVYSGQKILACCQIQFKNAANANHWHSETVTVSWHIKLRCTNLDAKLCTTSCIFCFPSFRMVLIERAVLTHGTAVWIMNHDKYDRSYINTVNKMERRRATVAKVKVARASSATVATWPGRPRANLARGVA